MLPEQPVAGSGIAKPRQEISVKNDVGTTKAISGAPRKETVGSSFIRDLRFFIEEEEPGPVNALSEQTEKIEEKSLVTSSLEKALITI